MVCLFPFAIGVVFSLAAIFGQLSEKISEMLIDFPFPLVTLFIILLMLLLRWMSPSLNRIKNDFILAIPAFMAPLALFSPWTIAPSHLGGIGWGGILFFLQASTRYPDFGQLNLMVSLGIAAMFCVSLLPPIIAWGYFAEWPIRVLSVPAVIFIFAYIAVTTQLDVYLWLAGYYGVAGDWLLYLWYGPIIHSMALLSICYLLLQLKHESRQNEAIV